MEEKSTKKTQRYFAAANTYRGFKSYFSEIFDPKEYARIYVIKGGPGTGKSSMMKKIAATFVERNCDIEEIYCSSDPHSLDGVICENGSKKIAVLDGTAPHETDAKIPGAIDEIMNLGENWDARWLSAKRTEITALNKEKSTAYKTAYSYLKIAGEAADFIISVTSEAFDFKEAKSAIKSFCQELNCENNEHDKIRLISSFGKHGAYKLDTVDNIAKKRVMISGDEFPVMLLTSEISKYLYALGISCIRFPSALNPSYLDAIYIPCADTVFIIGDGEGINAEEMIGKTPGYNSERVKNAHSIREVALLEAKRWFSIASDLHFRLEDIYSSAMSFDKNDALLTKKLEEMQNILEV